MHILFETDSYSRCLVWGRGSSAPPWGNKFTSPGSAGWGNHCASALLLFHQRNVSVHMPKAAVLPSPVLCPELV